MIDSSAVVMASYTKRVVSPWRLIVRMCCPTLLSAAAHDAPKTTPPDP
jgi:hypothetical protein